MKKYTDEEAERQYELMKDAVLSDTAFLKYCLKILAYEKAERCSGRETEEAEQLQLYATNKQWKNHPLMYELIVGDGLDHDMFNLVFEQPFYVEGKRVNIQSIK